MKMWRLMDPVDHSFARAGLRGTWESEERRGVCPACTSTAQTRVKPLVIVWEPGSDVLGDFVWPGFAHDVAIKGPLFQDLNKSFHGFEPGPVEMVQDPSLKKPGRNTKRVKPRVWLPYDSPLLLDLWVTSWVHIDPERSTAMLVKDCRTCGQKQYEIIGIERRSTEFDNERMELAWILTPRVPDEGLFLRESDLSGADIFRVPEFPGWILCTDSVKKYIEDRQWTNIAFLEYGDVL